MELRWGWRESDGICRGNDKAQVTKGKELARNENMITVLILQCGSSARMGHIEDIT
jgi:hypothetical protein